MTIAKTKQFNPTSIDQLEAATTAQLVAFYNESADTPVKRFSDKPTAIKRCAPYLKEEKKTVKNTYKRATKEDLDHLFGKKEAKAAEPVVKRTREESITAHREGVARTWKNPEVAASRLIRNGVTVKINGREVEFQSTRVAFAALGLPDSKHIRFRQVLKAAGEAVFSFGKKEYSFSLV